MKSERFCSAYEPGVLICDNGFPVNAACSGSYCYSCGRPTTATPACLREDLGAHLLDDAGRPRIVRFDALAAQAKKEGSNHE